MVAVMAARDPIADAYEAAEERLCEWGSACRKSSEALGLPTLSSIASMIEHVRRQERLQKGVRKKKLRKKHAELRKQKLPVDAKEAAEVRGFVEPELTATGKQKASFKPTSLTINSTVAHTDAVIGTLPGWARKVIERSYRYGQPDRIAAGEMHMRPDEYASRRRAAVEQVAAKLAERYIRHTSREG